MVILIEVLLYFLACFFRIYSVIIIFRKYFLKICIPIIDGACSLKESINNVISCYVLINNNTSLIERHVILFKNILYSRYGKTILIFQYPYFLYRIKIIQSLRMKLLIYTPSQYYYSSNTEVIIFGGKRSMIYSISSQYFNIFFTKTQTNIPN